MLKKVTSVILVVALVLGMIPAAFAAETPTAEEQSQQITRAEVCYALWSLDGHQLPNLRLDFTDVDESNPLYTAIAYAVSRGFVSGTGANTFEPDGSLSRAQAALLLWRINGEPAVDPGTVQGFEDVENALWYYPAVTWLSSVVANAGTSETTFSPTDPCTKEDFMLFLYGAVEGSADGGHKHDAWDWADSKGLIYRDGMQTGALFVQGAGVMNGTITEYWMLYPSAFVYPYSHIIRFCLGNQENFTPLDVKSVSASDPDVLLVDQSNRYPGHWVFTYNHVGTTDVTVVTADDQSYTMTIEVVLTDSGFFTSTQRDESTVIRGDYDFRTEGNTFYCLEDGDWAFIPDGTVVTVDDNPSYVTVSLVNVGQVKLLDGTTENRNAIKIELDPDNTPDGSYLCLNYQVKCLDGNTEFRGSGIMLGSQNGPSGPQDGWFSCQIMHPDGNGGYVPEAARYSGFGGKVNGRLIIHPMLPDGTEVTVQSSNPSVAEVVAGPDSFQTLRFVGQGYTTLTYTDGSGVTYYGDAFCEADYLQYAFVTDHGDGTYTVDQNKTTIHLGLSPDWQSVLLYVETRDGSAVKQLSSVDPSIAQVTRIDGTDYWRVEYCSAGKTALLSDTNAILGVACQPMEYLQIELMHENGSGGYNAQTANYSGIGRPVGESMVIYPLLDGMNDGSITLTSDDTSIVTVTPVPGTDYWEVAFVGVGDTTISYDNGSRIYTLDVYSHPGSGGSGGPSEEPGLFLQRVRLNWETGEIIDTDRVWENEFRIGNMWETAVFCNGISNSYTELNVIRVTSSDPGVVSVTQNERFPQYWCVEIKGLGKATLALETGSGETYTMDVEGLMPTHAYASEPKLTPDTLLGEYYDLNDGNVFYLVVDSEWQYIPDGASVSVEVNGRPASYVTWELVPMEGDPADSPRRAIRISIDREQAPADFWLLVRHDVTDASSGRVMSWGRSLRVVEPGLFMQWVNMDWDTGEVFGTENVWEDEFKVGNGWSTVVFCNGTSNSYTQLNVIRATSSDPGVVSVTQNERLPQYWCVEIRELGNATLTLETGSGETYTMDVEGLVPTHAYVSAPKITPDTLLGWDYDLNDGNVFYLVVDADWAYIPDGAWVSVEVNGSPASYVTWDLVPMEGDAADSPRRAIRISIDREQAPADFQLQVNHDVQDADMGGMMNWGRGQHVVKPGLFLMGCNVENGTAEPWGSLEWIEALGGYWVKICDGYTSDYKELKVTSVVSSDPDVAELVQMQGAPEGCWWLECSGVGTVTFTMTTDDGAEYTMSVTVNMPDFPFCKEIVATPQNLIRDSYDFASEGNVFYLTSVYADRFITEDAGVTLRGDPDISDYVSYRLVPTGVMHQMDDGTEVEGYAIEFTVDADLAPAFLWIDVEFEATDTRGGSWTNGRGIQLGVPQPDAYFNIMIPDGEGGFARELAVYTGIGRGVGESVIISLDDFDAASAPTTLDPAIASIQPGPQPGMYVITFNAPGYTTLVCTDTQGVTHYADVFCEVWNMVACQVENGTLLQDWGEWIDRPVNDTMVIYVEAYGNPVTDLVSADPGVVSVSKVAGTDYWEVTFLKPGVAALTSAQYNGILLAYCEVSHLLMNIYEEMPDGSLQPEYGRFGGMGRNVGEEVFIEPFVNGDSNGIVLESSDPTVATVEPVAGTNIWKVTFVSRGYTALHFVDPKTGAYCEFEVFSHEHTWDEGTELIPATCTEPGEKVFVCMECGAEYVEILEALGHDLTAHAAVEAKCEEDGNDAYWSCDRCGKYFSDAEGKTEIAENSWIIEALGHNFTKYVSNNDATCTKDGTKTASCDHGCGKTDTIADEGSKLPHTPDGETDCAKASYCTVCQTELRAAGSHTWNEGEVTTKPTCTEKGVKTYTCTVCKTTRVEDIDALGHTLTGHEAVPATCTEAGSSAYWSCDVCGKYFSDAEGKTEIAEDSWIVPAKGHALTGHEAVPATCTEAGSSAYWSCDVCGKYFSDAEGKTEIAENSWIIPVKGHTLTAYAAVDAGCEKAGNTAYWSCRVCGKYFSDAEGKTEVAKDSWVIPATGHSYTDQVTAPTCTAQGYTTHTCSACGSSYVDTVVKALGHKWNEGVDTVPATPETAGIRTYTCTVCNATRTESIPALGHVFVAGTPVAPTCTAKGYTVYICTTCPAGSHNYISDYVDALGHSYTDQVTAPTCTAQGYTTHTCSVCGNSYTDAFVNATGHIWDEGEVTVEPTADANGVTTYTCTVCQATRTESIPALGHTFVADTPVAPTCTAQGYTVYRCENCPEGTHTFVSDYVPAKGHTYRAEVTAPTCTVRGYTTYTCADCGNSFVSNYVNATGHIWTGVITTEPTSDEDGVMTYTCSACGATRTEMIPKLGHHFTSEVTAPTCTARGYTTYTCTTCTDHSYVADYVDALGHKYQVTVTAPTCTTRGYTTYACETCGYKQMNNFVDALGHSYAITEVVPATADEAGYTTYTCVCGDSYQVEIPMLGHEFTAEITAPTCTEQGYTTYTCETCRAEGKTHTYTDNYVPAKGHEWVAGTPVAANCLHGGYTPYECSACHEKKLADQTAMTDHNFVDGVCTVCEAKDLTQHSDSAALVLKEWSSEDLSTELGEVFEDADMLQNQMEEQTKLINNGEEHSNAVLFSVELKIEGTVAAANNFPEDGVEVVIPYPAGTDKNVSFSLTHMFAETYGGNAAGEMEHPSFWLEDDGIHFIVHSLSPILLAWNEPDPEPDPGPIVVPPASYDITAGEAENGTVSISADSAVRGKTVTITVTPDKGYALDTLIVKDADGKDVKLTKTGENTYTFRMPGSDTTVDVTFKWAECARDDTCDLVKFVDLNSGLWYHDAVEYCIEKGIMKGVGNDKFAPGGDATRAMIVTMIARLANADDPSGKTWYSNAVAWAMKMNITDGSYITDNITREQVVAMLYRYSKLAGMDVSASAELDGFEDAAAVHGWAVESMKWAVATGLIEGNNNRLCARENATRAQIATMFFRYCEIIAK